MAAAALSRWLVGSLGYYVREKKTRRGRARFAAPGLPARFGARLSRRARARVSPLPARAYPGACISPRHFFSSTLLLKDILYSR